MSWDKKLRGPEAGYYYLGRREAGRVCKEYVGSGPAAEAVARAVGRRKRDRAAARLARVRVAEADRLAAAALKLAVRLARAELLLAGYYQHGGGGPWRRRRGKRACD
jgi:hypothetical protein